MIIVRALINVVWAILLALVWIAAFFFCFLVLPLILGASELAATLIICGAIMSVPFVLGFVNAVREEARRLKEDESRIIRLIDKD